MRLTLAAAFLIAAAGGAAAQQPQKNVSSAFNGFSTTSGEPVNVESDNLEVHDADNLAIFTGNVVLKQGDSTLNSRKLTIYYYDKDEKPPAAPAAQKPTQGATQNAGGAAAPESGRDIKKMEAEGDVVVVQKDQRATGAKGLFDTAANTAVLTGGVTVTQNDSIVKGSTLHVDMNTQTSRIESGPGGRVQSVFKPKQQAGGASK